MKKNNLLVKEENIALAQKLADDNMLNVYIAEIINNKDKSKDSLLYRKKRLKALQGGLYAISLYDKWQYIKQIENELEIVKAELKTYDSK
jgi:hypothetical protein